MKPKNNKEIWKSYWLFSFYLVCSVGIAVLVYSLYVKTSKVEVNQIVSKTEESDKIYVQQIELTQKIDSLYKYTTMFNTNLNDGLLLNAVSKRKQDILTDIEKLSDKDAKLYTTLMMNLRSILSSTVSLTWYLPVAIYLYSPLLLSEVSPLPNSHFHFLAPLVLSENTIGLPSSTSYGVTLACSSRLIKK